MIRSATVVALLSFVPALGAAPQAWDLNAIPKNTWVQVPTTYLTPSIGGSHWTSGYHKAVYDSVSGRTLLWDMWGAPPTYWTHIYQNALIEFLPATGTGSLVKISNWSTSYPLPEDATDPTPPPHHTSGAYAFVPIQNAVYMTNGLNQTIPPNDHSPLNYTWKCDLATKKWTKLAPTIHPSLVRGADVMTYDEGEGKIVFFLSTFGSTGQTWLLDVASGQWSMAHPPEEPPARAISSMAYDPVRRRTLMFSGDTGMEKDLRAYDAGANAWTRLADAPAGAGFVSLAYDSKYDVFVASFNEPDSNAVPNRMLVYTPTTDTWTELFPPPGDTWPSITRKSTMVYDVANDVFVYQGGLSDSPKWYVFRYDPGTPPAATLSVTSPNGGETWTAGSSATVSWTSTGALGNVNIDLSTDGGVTWTPLVSDTLNDGAQTITVPDTASGNCRVRVQEVDGSPGDVSDSSFSIVSPPADLTPTPAGGGGTDDGRRRRCGATGLEALLLLLVRRTLRREK